MPHSQYIDGEWTEGAGTETFHSYNPATGDQLGEFERGVEEDVATAIAAADEAGLAMVMTGMRHFRH